MQQRKKEKERYIEWCAQHVKIIHGERWWRDAAGIWIDMSDRWRIIGCRLKKKIHVGQF